MSNEKAFENWSSSCDSYILRARYDAKVKEYYAVNKYNPVHLNDNDALKASEIEAWGFIAFIAASDLKDEKIKELEDRLKTQGENLHHYTMLQIDLEFKNRELKDKIEIAYEALEKDRTCNMKNDEYENTDFGHESLTGVLIAVTLWGGFLYWLLN